MKIIANPDVLEEDYIPPEIPCRESQKKELAYCLSFPRDCLCHGKPGTGKTLTVRYILDQLTESKNVLTFFINCWESRTLNQVLDEILRKVELPVMEQNTHLKLSRLKEKIKVPTIIVLDEIDKVETRELNDMLYLLKRIGKVFFVCISNSRKFILNLDPRVTSRFSFHLINFPPYSDRELETILRQRIYDCKAIYPYAISKKVIDAIIELAEGDARVAIQILRNAAKNAESENRSKIVVEDVKKVRIKVEKMKIGYILDKLGKHHQILYKIIREKSGITSKELFKRYKEECQKIGLKHRSERSVRKYISQLISAGIIM